MAASTHPAEPLWIDAGGAASGNPAGQHGDRGDGGGNAPGDHRIVGPDVIEQVGDSETEGEGEQKSSIAFDYRIMAKRVGYENVRLTDVTEQLKRRAEQRNNMGHPAKASPQVPTQPAVVTPPAKVARLN